METENKDLANVPEIDQKKLAGLTIGVGVGTVAATGATIGAVVSNVMDYEENGGEVITEVSVDTDEVLADEEVVVDEEVVLGEEEIEADEIVVDDSLEMLDQDTCPEFDDTLIDDVPHDDELLDDTLNMGHL